MFGYVRPLKGELKVSEFDRFQAAYCGLCHELAHRYGFGARFLLNYDLAFFAAAADGLEGGAKAVHRRCVASPFRRKCTLSAGNGMSLAADLTVILGYWKLDDAVRDDGFWKGLGSRILRLLLKPYYRKARRLRPELCERVRSSMTALSALEDESCSSLDRCADAFAQILDAAGSELGDEHAARMFYHIGRWIYVVDACDDIDEDIAERRFNPIAERYGLNGGLDDATRQAVRSTLGHSLDAAWLEAKELDFGVQSALVENTLRLGLYMVMEEVLAGRWKSRNKDKKEL